VETISQRQLRNQSGEVLRRVAAGESFLISNDGAPTAVLTPVPATEQEQLVASGRLRPPRRPRAFAAAGARRVRSSTGTSEQVPGEDRGER